MRGLSRSDGARKRDHERSDGARIFARYGSLIPLMAALAPAARRKTTARRRAVAGYGTGGTNESGSAGKAASGSASGGQHYCGHERYVGQLQRRQPSRGLRRHVDERQRGHVDERSGGATGGTGGAAGGASGGKGGNGGSAGATGALVRVAKVAAAVLAAAAALLRRGRRWQRWQRRCWRQRRHERRRRFGRHAGLHARHGLPNDDNTIHNVCDAGKCRARAARNQLRLRAHALHLGTPTAGSALRPGLRHVERDQPQPRLPDPRSNRPK